MNLEAHDWAAVAAVLIFALGMGAMVLNGLRNTSRRTERESDSV